MVTDRREKWAGRELTNAAVETPNSQDLQLAHWSARRANGLDLAWIFKTEHQDSSQCGFQF